MPLEITFELSDQDLEFLRSKSVSTAQQSLEQGETNLLNATRDTFKVMQGSEIPTFVSDRADKLQLLVEMLEDDKWRLSGEDRERVIRAVAYFAEPEDLIPDSIPGLGFLDDAIMIELVVRDLKHEIEAYQDFLKAIANGHELESKAGQMTSDEWIELKRHELHKRMQRRRRRRGRGRSEPKRTRSPFALF